MEVRDVEPVRAGVPYGMVLGSNEGSEIGEHKEEDDSTFFVPLTPTDF